MGSEYTQRAQEGAGTAQVEPPRAGPASGQTRGNAEAQQELVASSTAEGAGPGVPVDPGGGAGAVAGLVDAVSAVWAARVDGVDDVWDKAAGERAPDAAADLLIQCATAAVAAATGLFTGPVVSAAVGALTTSEPCKAVLEAAIGPLVDQVQGGVIDGVTAAVDTVLAGSGPAVDGYYLGVKSGLRVESVAAMGAWRSLGNQLVALPGGDQAVALLTRLVAQDIVHAETLQMQRSVVEWMNVLACAATGRRADQGADLTRAGSGRSALDQLLGRYPSGVIHLSVQFGSYEDVPAIREAWVTGLNDELLGLLLSSGTSLGGLGVPVFVEGLTADGGLELGRNERGLVTHNALGGGYRWLDGWAAAHGTDRDGAARSVVDRVTAVDPSDLPGLG